MDRAVPGIGEVNLVVTASSKERDPPVDYGRDPETQEDFLGRGIDEQGINPTRISAQDFYLGS